jgi:hypothetical protein
MTSLVFFAPAAASLQLVAYALSLTQKLNSSLSRLVVAGKWVLSQRLTGLFATSCKLAVAEMILLGIIPTTAH